MDLFDKLDARRHDAMAIVDAANAFANLTDAEQEEHVGLWGFAGMDEAQHALTALLRESHNDGCVIRDLDGSLVFLWQEVSTSDRWLTGPLFQENLIDDSELKELLDGDPDWLADREISLAREEVVAVIAQLPNAPGPVTRF